MGQEIRKAYADSSLGQIHYRIAGQGKPLLLVHQDPQSALPVFICHALIN